MYCRHITKKYNTPISKKYSIHITKKYSIHITKKYSIHITKIPILITTDVIIVLQLYFVNVKLSLNSEGIGGRDGIVLGILKLDTR
jgi:hypothetical protein